jgi:hypothetical protein
MQSEAAEGDTEISTSGRQENINRLDYYDVLSHFIRFVERLN